MCSFIYQTAAALVDGSPGVGAAQCVKELYLVLTMYSILFIYLKYVHMQIHNDILIKQRS